MFSQTIYTLLALTSAVQAYTIPKGYQVHPLFVRDFQSYQADLIGPKEDPIYIPIEIGSIHQKFNVEIDTGSYDFFVPNYLYNSSTTVEYIDEGTGWDRPVSWIRDNVTLGDTPDIQVAFGVYQDVAPNSGGVGIIGAHFIQDQQESYFHILKDQGYIEKAAFSLWYDSLYNVKRIAPFWNSSIGRGEAIFGVYDKAKYQGPLVKTNLTHVGEGSWNVPVDAVITPDGKSHFQGLGATFDTGNYDINLSQDDLQELQQSLNGTSFQSGADYPIIYENPHDFTDDDKLVFKYGEALIEVYLRDIIEDEGSYTYLRISEGEPAFGAAFISNAFIIFDIEEKTVSLANRKFTNETDIQIIQ